MTTDPMNSSEPQIDSNVILRSSVDTGREAHPGRTALMLFDRPSSFLGILGRPELDAIGLMLDAKIDAVVRHVCEDDAEEPTAPGG